MMKQSLSLIFLTVITKQMNAQSQQQVTINQEAPVIKVGEIIINTEPENIWNVLINIENWGDWNKRIKKPTLQNELKAGSAFTWRTNGSKIKSKIHTLSEYKMLGWTGKTFGAKAIHNWYLEPIMNGTKVIVEESMEGWIVKLFKKKMNRKLADDIQYWLEQLKLESEK